MFNLDYSSYFTIYAHMDAIHRTQCNLVNDIVRHPELNRITREYLDNQNLMHKSVIRSMSGIARRICDSYSRVFYTNRSTQVNPNVDET
jgi:hypothetical protein